MTKQITYSPKAIEILDVAERYMRRGGFSAVSFREIATEVGVKSASVHYHFPQKSDLGRALVQRYTKNIMDHLGDPLASNATVTDGISRLASAYRAALHNDDSVCLCAKLGAEIRHLPDDVAIEVRQFFKSVLGWATVTLAVHMDKTRAAEMAAQTISALQGAMVLAVALEDNSHFTTAEAMLFKQLEAAG